MTGARVLTSAECLSILREKEERKKIQEQEKEERRRMKSRRKRNRIPDPVIQKMVGLMEAADNDERLREVFDDSEHETVMLETGCRKVLSQVALSDKASLQATLKTHMLLKVKAELDQFVEGLTVCGVLDVVRAHPMLMASYFVHVPLDLSADYFRSLFHVILSNRDARREKERTAYNFFVDYVEDCEGGGVTTDAGDGVTLKHHMLFFSTAVEEPPFSFVKKPVLMFVDGNLAAANTCDKILKLPYWHKNYSTFKHYVTLSLMGHGGFGQV
jgi:hypothetical protein